MHVYIGIVGALIALIHTGHKYASPLGIALTATMMLLVVGGFIVRYLLVYVGHDIKDKLSLLQTARGDLDNAWGVLENSPAEAKTLPKSSILAAGMLSLRMTSIPESPANRVMMLADEVADLEYSVRAHEILKRWFGLALTAHIALSVVFCVLLVAHVAAGIYFGLRWLR